MSRVTLIVIFVSAGGCFDVLYGPAYDLERERVTRETHTPIFPIASGAHDAMDCDHCHSEFDTFTRFTCISCKDHEQSAMDPLHQNNAGYVYSETSCYDCHPTGEGMTREQHQQYFPISNGKHSDAACSECHPNGYGDFSCTNCHEHRCTEMNGHHQDIPGYACESSLCLECHPNGTKEED